MLLLGGMSRRFGSVKALAPLAGETLAERAWRALGEAFPHRLAVGKAADQIGLPFPLLDDGIAVRAPIAGSSPASRGADRRRRLSAVDCPLMTPDALRSLADACADAAVPETGPLPGAYAKSALPSSSSGSRRATLRWTRRSPSWTCGRVELDAELLANVNTERDLDRLRALAT